jgi:hypothetical protein
MGLSCREVQCEVEVLGFYGPWRSRPSGAACRVLGYSFPPLSGESDILFNQEQGSPTVRHSGECWTSVHLGRLASWQLQSSGLSFRGEAGVPALRQGRLDSPVGRRGEKCWASVHFRVAVWCCPQSRRLQLPSPQWGNWHSCSLMGSWELSNCQAQWGVLGFCASQEAGLLVPLTK